MASTPLPASATTRRSASWLMMFATPVLSSAWSSTTRTVDATTGVTPSDDHMDLRRQRGWVPRQHDLRVEFRRNARGQRGRFPLRRLQLHQNRAESLRQIVVNVTRETVAFLERHLAALLESTLFDEAVEMKGQRRLTRDRLDEDDAP